MFRAVTISLVLMGGGLVTLAALRPPSDRCAVARAQNLPDADQICAQSRGHGAGGGHASGSFGGSSAGGSGSSSVGVARGGFGGSGASAGE